MRGSTRGRSELARRVSARRCSGDHRRNVATPRRVCARASQPARRSAYGRRRTIRARTIRSVGHSARLAHDASHATRSRRSSDHAGRNHVPTAITGALARPSRACARSGAHESRNLLIRGKAFQLELREQGLAVDRDLECAAFRFDELDFDLRKSPLELRGQTGRLRQIVSLNAVLNRDLHRRLRLSSFVRRIMAQAARSFNAASAPRRKNSADSSAEVHCHGEC